MKDCEEESVDVKSVEEGQRTGSYSLVNKANLSPSASFLDISYQIVMEVFQFMDPRD